MDATRVSREGDGDAGVSSVHWIILCDEFSYDLDVFLILERE